MSALCCLARLCVGGSSGVQFLKKALELSFFSELFEVRTLIGPKNDAVQHE
jgi:tryptophan 2,3-dioxygenase